MTLPEVLSVTWPEVEAWLYELAREVPFDTIVGVTRCGLPLAAALSALVPEAALAVLSRRGPRGAKPPRYDFEAERAARLAVLSASFELTSLPKTAERILIIDDVATSGDTLFVAGEKVRAVAPKAEIAFAAYAADEVRLRLGRPEIVDRFHRQIAIDNARTWISFPWNLDPITQ